VTHTTEFSNEAAFLSAFTSCISASGDCSVSNVQTDHLRRHQSAIGIFSSQPPEGIFTSAYSFAKTIRDVWQNFFASVRTSLCTVSPMFTMPESDFTKYELDYRLLGKVSAETLIDNLAERTETKSTVLENTGFRTWSGFSPAWKPKSRKRLNVLTLDSPADAAIGSLSRIYAQTTGVEVNISVLSYDEVYKVFTSMDDSSGYDVVRLDVTWLSWFAQRILRPLEDIDPGISSVFERFLPGLSRQYSYVRDTLYALPVSPSNQILFYRKDMFESTVLKRLYHEAYKARLSPPKSFKEYNRIARFFTRAENGQSPLEFGTTVTLGSTGVAGTEFITRYFSYADKLFTDEGCILLESEQALHALQDLIEVRGYSKEQPCAWWTNAAQEFAHGNTAMTILYSNFASDLLGKDSRVINKIGYAVVPGANPIIGGGTLGVSKFSRFPEQALAFIRWMCSEPISSALTLLGSVPACRNSFENYEIVDIYPWLELSKECVGLSHFRRTPSINNSPFDERRFLEILGSAVMKAYYGKVSAREALSEAQQQYEANARALTGRA
jgi:multiple sugar transport system substrate-binding protein